MVVKSRGYAAGIRTCDVPYDPDPKSIATYKNYWYIFSEDEVFVLNPDKKLALFSYWLSMLVSEHK